MATDDADASDSGQIAGDESEDAPAPEEVPAAEMGDREPARVGEYTWDSFMREHGHPDAADVLYPDDDDVIGRAGDPEKPSGDDWAAVEFDPEEYLGFHPDDVEDRIAEAVGGTAEKLYEGFDRRVDPDRTHVAKDRYGWEQFKREYYYDENGEPPTTGDDEVVPFDPAEYLGWEPERTGDQLDRAGDIADRLDEVVENNTVTTMGEFDESDLQAVSNVSREEVERFDEDAFFTDEHGNTTLVNRYDLEKAVPDEKKTHFREEDRYWVNKPYAFVVIFHSIKENEKKYYAIEPHRNEIEDDLQEFMSGKLRTAIKYSDDEVVVEGSQADRAAVIEREARRLLERYDIYDGPAGSAGGGGGLLASLGLDGLFGDEAEPETETSRALEGIEARPEPVILDEDPGQLSEYQVEKLLYFLKRNFIGYERIDPIKEDTVHVEDISCDGYDSPVFVYHSEYEQIITNIYHGREELNDFVVKLAQRSGKGISKRNPQVDATLPDGSRAQLTLGEEVSDHGTNYTIRQFKEVPFTPIDQISWNTLSLDQTAFLWLCIENHKSMIIAGGTATGKTTLLNALSLFIPSNAKIVSIEDTREVELPQRNWIASVTRPSFGEDDTGDVDEFDLLEAALRQRPDYIVMGEVRGEEGRDLFQVMSTGHTSYSTFHADSVGEVLKRFTTDPINVSKTMFTALDLVAIQTRTRVDGHKVVRNKNLTEINHYDAENDEINVQDVYQWQAETDEFLKMGESNTLEEIMFDRGWTHDRLQQELFKREVILAYLIHNDLNTYTEVAATIQAFINDPDTILTLIANDRLQESLEDLREMESVEINVSPEKEEMAPRPEPSDETEQLCLDILDRAEDSLLDDYRGEEAMGLAGAIEDEEEAETERLELPEGGEEADIEFSGELREDAFQADDVDMESDAERVLAAAEGSGGSDTTADADAAEDVPDAAGEVEDGAVVEAADDDESPGWLFGDDEDEEFGFDEAGAEEAAEADAGPSDDGNAAGDDGLAFGTDPTDEGVEGTSGAATTEGTDDAGFAFAADDEGDEGDEGDDAGSDDGVTFAADDGDGTGESSGGGLAFEGGGADADAGDADDGGVTFGDAGGGDDDVENADGGDDDGGDADGGDDDGGFAFDEDESEDDEESSGGLAFGTDGGDPEGES